MGVNRGRHLDDHSLLPMAAQVQLVGPLRLHRVEEPHPADAAVQASDFGGRQALQHYLEVVGVHDAAVVAR